MRSGSRRLFAAVLASLFILDAVASAHEVPNEVTVHSFLRPQGQTLTFLVRVPMKALRDIDVPRRERDFLDFPRIQQALEDAAMLWIGDFVQVYENGQLVAKPVVAAARVSLPSDRSFNSFEEALAHLKAPPLDNATDLYWEEGLLDVAFEYPIVSDASDFSIRPGLTRLGLQVNVTMRFRTPAGVERAFDVHEQHGLVDLDPRWHQAALRFVWSGYEHILGGIDHLLFLLCLVIPFRRFRPLIAVVTSFTVAHSITLIASAFDMAPGALWFPPFIETLIAASIVYMALENIVGARLGRRWVITFGFGLVHGFGFSFALRESLQFAGSHLVTSLLAFNVGVELGQLLVLVILIPILSLLFRFVVAERMGTILLSAFVAHTSWHWLTERWEVLAKFPLTLPAFDASFFAALLRWLMMLMVAGGLAWIVSSLIRRGVSESDDRAIG
jgi:hypothetical protein